MVAAACVAAVAVPLAAASPETTTPGQLYVVKVTVTDKTISIPKDQFTRNGVTRYPRGALIRYVVTNLGTRSYAFEIWGASTGPIRPRGHNTVLVAWNRRGTFIYRTLIAGGRPAGPKGIVQIF
jgi:hypothetical protein